MEEFEPLIISSIEVGLLVSILPSPPAIVVHSKDQSDWFPTKYTPAAGVVIPSAKEIVPGCAIP